MAPFFIQRVGDEPRGPDLISRSTLRPPTGVRALAHLDKLSIANGDRRAAKKRQRFARCDSLLQDQPIRWPSSRSTAQSCSKYRMTRSGTAFTRPKLPPSRLSPIRSWMRSRMFSLWRLREILRSRTSIRWRSGTFTICVKLTTAGISTGCTRDWSLVGT
jgi:hypothetical protein